jgi:hypothetical protein
METFQIVSKMLLERVTRDLKRSTGGSRSASQAAPSAPAPAPAPAPLPVAAATATAGARPPSRFTTTTKPEPAPAARPASAPAAMPAWNGAPSEPAYGREVALPAVEKMRPAMSAPAPQERFEAPASSPENLVVPVRIPRGQKLREITLRIVIENEEAA